MARQEQDREDLLREATALVERAELKLSGRAEPVVFGFRRDSCLSLYFTADEAYHFNSRRQLRRAYIAGRLFKAEAAQLVALDRVRDAGEVQLVRHELTTAEADLCLARFSAAANRLLEQLNRQEYHLVGQVPTGVDVVSRMIDWLRQMDCPPMIADRPNAV